MSLESFSSENKRAFVEEAVPEQLFTCAAG